MTDKNKQENLPLGDVEYITDPNFVPERYIDKIGTDSLETEHYFNLVKQLQDQESGTYFDFPICGDLEGDTFLIIDSWEQLANLIAKLNGWKGAIIANHFDIVPLEVEIENTLESYNKALNAGKYAGRYEQQLNKLNSLKDYKSWLELNEYEAVDLDSFGLEYGFSDEYSRCACDNCSNIVRTSPDCYTWTPPTDIGYGYISDECVESGQYDEDLLDTYANEQKSLPEIRSPEKLGLVKVNKDSFENGMHEGMNDSPVPIIEALNSESIDVWFKVYPSQFHAEFDVYVRQGDLERAMPLLGSTDTYQGFSGAANLKKALSNVPMGTNSPDSVTVSTVDVSTGTVKTKVVSNQEFIDGKALN